MTITTLKKILILLVMLAMGFLLFASGPADQTGTAAQKKFGYGEALILGLVEGVTEFLPVSSTGHLILADHFLGLDDETVKINAGPKAGYISLKEAVDIYIIVIQGGAIAAILLLYWGKVWSVALGFLGRSREGLLLGRNLVVAFLPAAVLGLALDKTIEKHLFGAVPVVIALLAGAALMLGVERWRKRKNAPATKEPNSHKFSLVIIALLASVALMLRIERWHKQKIAPVIREPDLHELSIGQSLMIGFMQCLALWPGTSRSMAAMVGGYFAGLNPRRAAEFSFLLGLVTLGAATVYKCLKNGPAMLAVVGWGPGLLGCLVAMVSAALAVKWMVSYLTRHGLEMFAWYRILLALVVLALL